MLRFGAGILVSLLTAATAWGQEACPVRHEIADYLANEFQEQPVASGLANNGGVVEVFASDDQETWTIIITMPSGRSCMIAAGQGWAPYPFEAPASDTEQTAEEPGA